MAEEREKLGLSRHAFAARLGVTATTIARCERGHGSPNHRNALALRGFVDGADHIPSLTRIEGVSQRRIASALAEWYGAGRRAHLRYGLQARRVTLR